MMENNQGDGEFQSLDAQSVVREGKRCKELNYSSDVMVFSLDCSSPTSRCIALIKVSNNAPIKGAMIAEPFITNLQEQVVT